MKPWRHTQIIRIRRQITQRNGYIIVCAPDLKWYIGFPCAKRDVLFNVKRFDITVVSFCAGCYYGGGRELRKAIGLRHRGYIPYRPYRMGTHR